MSYIRRCRRELSCQVCEGKVPERCLPGEAELPNIYIYIHIMIYIYIYLLLYCMYIYIYIYINQIIDIDYYILNAHMYRAVFFSFSSLFMLVSPSERCSHLGVEATVGKPSLGTVASFHRERRCQRSHSRQLCPTNPERSA